MLILSFNVLRELSRQDLATIFALLVAILGLAKAIVHWRERANARRATEETLETLNQAIRDLKARNTE
jgi:sensor domain CHASE-containing protein